MKILYRYVLTTFLSAFAIFAITLLALYLSVDLLTKLEKFLEAGVPNTAAFMFEFYLVHIPPFLVQLFPIITLFAATFTFIRLNRNNEIIPIAASGTSMHRIIRPFAGFALVVGLGIGAMEEWVLPKIGQEIARTEAILDRGKADYYILTRDTRGHVFFMQAFHHMEKRMSQVSITGSDADGNVVMKIFSEEGVYEKSNGKGFWRLKNGEVYYFLPIDEVPDFFAYEDLRRDDSNLPVGHAIPIAEDGLVIASNLNPDDIKNESQGDSMFSPLSRSYRLAKEHPNVPILTHRFHARLASPLTALVLLLLGPPFILGLHTRSNFVGLSICILIAVMFFACQFLAIDLARTGVVPPIPAAWASVAIFGTLGTYFTYRIPT